MNVNDIKTYKAIVLFREMLDKGRVFKINFNGNDAILEPLFIELYANKYVSIENGAYHVTKDGEDIYNNFMDKYREYLKVYDIFCKVDIGTGVFAFEKFYEYEDEVWDLYKNQERFVDVRVAVANFKTLDPFEIVFMSFINEDRFDLTKEGWQFDLYADTLWAEIENIVNTAITIEQLEGPEVVENIVRRGVEVMFELTKKEMELKKARLLELQNSMQTTGDSEEVEEEITEITTTINYCEEDLVYYDSYWDPWYYSPFWVDPYFYW